MNKFNVVEKIKVYEDFVYFEKFNGLLVWYELELVDRNWGYVREHYGLLEDLKKEVDRRVKEGVGRFVEL